MKKTYIVVASSIMLLFCLAYLGSYAYFSMTVTNDDEYNTNLNAGNVYDVTVSGGSLTSSSNLIPGETVTSTITVTNENSVAVCYSLYWSSYTNTFVNTSDLVVTLTDENGDEVTLSNTIFPNSSLNSPIYLVEGLTISANTSTTYTLSVTYQNTENDQSADMGASFSGTISAEFATCSTSSSSTTGADTILALYTTDSTELAYDDSNNLRYIGANPNNYIDIGDNVLWRIIGVFEVDDGTGNIETRLKIIRSSTIGSYSWDSSSYTSSNEHINYGYGVNEWSQADLMKLLNDGYESETVGGSLYWNSESGTCYSGTSNSTKDCDFTSTGLTTTAQSYFGDAVWNTGSNGTNGYTSSSNGLASHFYEYERSSDTGKICTSGGYCNDTVTRTTSWTGKIGLMYPSDYGYATSGGSTTDRDTCLATELYNWDGVSECYSNDWLYTGSITWTLMPRAGSSDADFVFRVNSTGRVHDDYAGYAHAVLPAGYLQSSISITSGDGSSSNPFVVQ